MLFVIKILVPTCWLRARNEDEFSGVVELFENNLYLHILGRGWMDGQAER